MTRRLLLAGIETTEGTDPNLTPALNAILTNELTLTPLEGDEIDRNLDTDEIGNAKALLTSHRASATYNVEAQGAGGAGDVVTGYGPLLRAAGFAETIDATPGTANVTYDMVDDLDTVESMHGYVYVHGKLHKIGGARQSMTVTATARDIMRFGFSVTGLFTPVTEQTVGAADFTKFQDPFEVKSGVTSLDIGGFSAVMESFELDIAHPVNFVSRVGVQKTRLGEPEPSGTLVIETPTLAAFNPFALAQSGETRAMKLTQGTAEGSIVEIELDAVQFLAPSYVDLDDVNDGISIPLRPIGSGIRVITR